MSTRFLPSPNNIIVHPLNKRGGVAVACGLTVAPGCAGFSAMDIWVYVDAGDVEEIERLVGQDPSLLNAGDEYLMLASELGHVEVVQWLLDKGASMQGQDVDGRTALWYASGHEHSPVVRLLLGRGADPAIADKDGSTPLMIASTRHESDVVRVLLDNPGGKATINHRNVKGETALWKACCYGNAKWVTALRTLLSPTLRAEPRWRSPCGMICVSVVSLSSGAHRGFFRIA
jgi:hypothetical protein